MALLKLDNVSKTYRRADGEIAALENVSAEIDRGEFVALQGPSGSGKTTLLLAAGALLHPDAGTVHFDGRDVYAMPSPERTRLRARRIGFVFQQFHLVPYLNVVENIQAASLGASAEGAEGRAKKLVRRFALDGRAGHRPGELSTGERQRVAMARAMLNSPGLLLADEPTGNLDEVNAETVLDCLAEFAAGGGAVLLVTHDKAVAARAQRALHIEAGRLRA